MRKIERLLLDEIEQIMCQKGLTQQDFATKKGISRQAVNPYFTGRRGLLTDTGKDLLEFLGMRIKLEPIEGGKDAS